MRSMLDDSSSDDDDDDIYTNAAARLRALKNHRPHKNISEDLESSLEISTDTRAESQSSPEPVRRSLRQKIRDDVPSDNVSLSNEVIIQPSIVLDDDGSVNQFPTPNSKIHDLVENDDCSEVDNNDFIDNEIDISNSSFETIRVTVRWKSRAIERLELHMHENFTKIFEYFATKENLPRNRIILLKKDVPIRMSDTPASIDLSIIDVLEGGIIDANMMSGPRNQTSETEKTVPGCVIKVQTSRKQSLSLRLNRDENFERLAIYCAEKLEIPVSKIKFLCDGERIMDSDTPDTLDFDDEGCVDLKIIA